MFKKIVNLLIACLLFVNFIPLRIYAESSSDNNLSNSETKSDEKIRYYEYENIIYKVMEDDFGKFYVIDTSINEVVSMCRVTYYETQTIQAKNEIIPATTNYESWNSYFVYSKGKIELLELGDSGAVAALICSALNIPSYVDGINCLLMVVDAIRDKHLANTYFIKYYSSNKNCGILQKIYSKFYQKSNYTGYIEQSKTYHEWLDTPWNYQNPAPCRVLVNTYSYV